MSAGRPNARVNPQSARPPSAILPRDARDDNYRRVPSLSRGRAPGRTATPMSEGFGRRAARALFGAEGSVVAEREAQAMTLASAVLAAGVVTISPLLASLAEVFAVSEAEVGLLVAVFTAPPIALIPVAGVLADRFGRKPLLVGGLVLYGLAGTLIALATSFEVALVLRAVQGVGFAAAMPLTITVLGDRFDGDREATAQGLRTAGNFLANMTTPVAASFLLLASWRYPFVVFALAVPIAAWVWVDLPATTAVGRYSLRGYLADLLALLRRPVMVLVLVSFVLRFFVFYGFLTYVSILGTRDVGLAAVGVGAAVSAKALGSVLGSTQVGRLVGRSHTALVIAGAFVLMGVGVGAPGVAPEPAVLAVGSVLLGVGDGIVAPVQKTLVSALAPTELRAGAISAASTFQNVGKATVPLVMAVVLTAAGAPTVFVLLGVAGLVGAALLVGVWAWTRTTAVLT